MIRILIHENTINASVTSGDRAVTMLLRSPSAFQPPPNPETRRGRIFSSSRLAGTHLHQTVGRRSLATATNSLLSSTFSHRRRPKCSATRARAEDGKGDWITSNDGWFLVVRAGEILSMAFPLWVSLACLLGLWRPGAFLWADHRWQITGLSLTMLGMGMTLTFDDLKGAILMPKELLIGFVLQYTVMPLSGFLVSKLLKLPSHYAAGLILVSCCPGGTASNIITFLARGNVALSVLMTASSTISAVAMTPLLTSKLAGQYVAVDPVGLFTSTVQVMAFYTCLLSSHLTRQVEASLGLVSELQVVLAPVLVGALLNQYFNNVVRLVSPLMPVIAVTSVAILCGSAISQNAASILSSGFQVVLASCILHASGFFFGYILSRVLGVEVSSSRTISIEVGMQNSVLGVVLAGQHFGNPLTAVPCAVSSVCHSIYGSVLAGVWRSMPAAAPVKD